MHINIIKYKILWTLMYVIFHTYSRIIDAFWTVCDCKLVSLLCEVFPSLIAAAGGDSMID
jgi:hypothetical protein